MPINTTETQKLSLHVLCAEDQPIYSDFIAARFQDAGHNVLCTPNGLAAWEAISEDFSRFDLLITDQQMPQLDGLSLVRRLREAGFHGRIIVYAGRLTAEAKSQFEHFNVDAILSKGPEIDLLLHAAEKLFLGVHNPVSAGALRPPREKGPHLLTKTLSSLFRFRVSR